MAVKLLFADDSVTMQTVMEMTVESEDIDLLIASDGKLAMELAKSQQPDIIIADVSMPEMNGLELCRTLKTTSETEQIPVILLTGELEKYDTDEGKSAGASAHITKPFKPEELLKKLRAVLEGTEVAEEEALPEEEIKITPPSPITGILNLTAEQTVTDDSIGEKEELEVFEDTLSVDEDDEDEADEDDDLYEDDHTDYFVGLTDGEIVDDEDDEYGNIETMIDKPQDKDDELEETSIDDFQAEQLAPNELALSENLPEIEEESKIDSTLDSFVDNNLLPQTEVEGEDEGKAGNEPEKVIDEPIAETDDEEISFDMLPVAEKDEAEAVENLVKNDIPEAKEWTGDDPLGSNPLGSLDESELDFDSKEAITGDEVDEKSKEISDIMEASQVRTYEKPEDLPDVVGTVNPDEHDLKHDEVVGEVGIDNETFGIESTLEKDESEQMEEKSNAPIELPDLIGDPLSLQPETDKFLQDEQIDNVDTTEEPLHKVNDKIEEEPDSQKIETDDDANDDGVAEFIHEVAFDADSDELDEDNLERETDNILEKSAVTLDNVLPPDESFQIINRAIPDEVDEVKAVKESTENISSSEPAFSEAVVEEAVSILEDVEEETKDEVVENSIEGTIKSFIENSGKDIFKEAIQKSVDKYVKSIVEQEAEALVKSEVERVVGENFQSAMPDLISTVDKITKEVTPKIAEEMIKRAIDDIQKNG